MNRAILLGTSHTIQRGDDQKDSFNFYLKKLCRIHEVKAIAEEIDNKHKSVAADMANVLKITHKIIEPTPDELEELGIEEVHFMEYQLMSLHEIDDWPAEPSTGLPADVYKEWTDRIQYTYRLRESEWLRRINKLNTWPVLIICGADHYQPFYELLVEAGIDVVKEEDKWGLQI